MPIELSTRPVRTQRPTRKARGSKASNRIMTALYNELVRICGPMVRDMESLIPWLESNPEPLLAMNALQEQRYTWQRVLGPSIRGIVSRWAHAVSQEDRIKLQKSLAKALGVQIATIFDDEVMKETIDMMSAQAVHLISTIPDVYYAKVQQAVFDSYQQERLPEGRSLLQEIKEIGKLTYERAKLISVDQTQKMHCVVTQTRQTSLGIEEYIWRTANDQRVVGNPTGLYPEGNSKHMNHYVRNGKKYRWDDPPPDGHPGWPIRCRCHAEPVIDYNKLKLV